MSLRARIWLYGIVLGFGPLLLLAIYSHQRATARELQSLSSLGLRQIEAQRAKLETLLDAALTDALSLAQMAVKSTTELDRVRRRRQQYGHVFYTNADGDVVMLAPRVRTLLGLRLGREPFFAPAMAREQTLVGPHVSPIGSYCLIATAPASDRGLIGIVIPLETLWPLIAESGLLHPAGRVRLVDRDGRIALGRELTSVSATGRRPAVAAPLARAAAADATRVVHYREGDEERFAIVAPLAGHGLALVSDIGTRQYLQPLRAEIRELLLLTAIVGSVAVLLATFLARRISAPLRRVVDGMASVAGGDLAHALAVEGDEEVAAVARHFNEMTRKLHESFATLEARVDERTRELAVARDRAEDASRAKTLFLAGMSHELRTPLNAIIGYSQLMIADEKDPGTVRDAGKILNAGQHLLELINDILDLSRLETGRVDLRLERVEIGALVDSAIQTIEPQMERNHNTLTVDVPDDIGHFQSDAVRLRQSLINLLGNAAKFTRNGTVRIAVERDDERVRFLVADDGIGMTAEQQRKIFDSFRQADTTIQRRYGGTGLGLSITRQLVEKMGGTIDVTSAPDEGATFVIELPATPPSAPEA